MKRSAFVVFASFSVCTPTVRAADATTPVDYTQRNAPFAPSPGGTVAPARQTPQGNAAVQDKRFDKAVVDKKTAPLADRRAEVDVTEAREKNVREKDSHRPEAETIRRSSFDHRTAGIATGGEKTRPQTVAKYQDSLTSATATNMAKYPAMDRATAAKINRFVFRKNPTEPTAAMDRAKVTPAAGGSVRPE